MSKDEKVLKDGQAERDQRSQDEEEESNIPIACGNSILIWLIREDDQYPLIVICSWDVWGHLIGGKGEGFFAPSLGKGRIFILGDGKLLKGVGGKALIIFFFFFFLWFHIFLLLIWDEITIT